MTDDKYPANVPDTADAETGTFSYPDDPFDSNELVTNDAVGGEPIEPTGTYAGADGAEPLEAAPESEEHEQNQDDGPSDLAGE